MIRPTSPFGRPGRRSTAASVLALVVALLAGLTPMAGALPASEPDEPAPVILLGGSFDDDDERDADDEPDSDDEERDSDDDVKLTVLEPVASPVAADSTLIKDPGSPLIIGEQIGAATLAARGFTGQGIDIALIDSGVSLVSSLSPRQVVHGVDLTAEAHDPATAHVDGFGHGTHLASLMVGGTSPLTVASSASHGLAPRARVVSVKVADREGTTDLDTVIAGIDWVVANRAASGLDIRVLVLAIGVDGAPPYRQDGLAAAVQRAWDAGLVVVVAAGNLEKRPAVTSPATNPYVIAVGGSDHRGTRDLGDDMLGWYSSGGSSARRLDVVAPGYQILGLRVPGSTLDADHPSDRASGLIRGSGTSQAAAITGAGVALLLDARPELNNDAVKDVLVASARSLRFLDGWKVGHLDLVQAMQTEPSGARQDHPRPEAVEISGDPEPSGNRWAGNRWAGNRWAGNRWASLVWAGLNGGEK